MQTFNSSRLKYSLLCFAAIFPFAFGFGLLLSFCDAHWNFGVFLMNLPFHIYMSCILAFVILWFPLFPIWLFNGINGVQVLSTGLNLIARGRSRGGCRDSFYEIPWDSIREVRMQPAFPRYLKMTHIELLCAEEGIQVATFFPSFFGMKKVPVSFGKNPPKNFAFAPRAFPSGLLIFPLPWQLKEPEEFKVAVLQEAPPDHPLAKLFREHPNLVQ